MGCASRSDPAYLASYVKGRALIPVSVPLSDGGDPHDCIRNNFAFISCRLALSEESPVQRLRKVASTMNRVKNSTKAPVALWMANRLLPKSLLETRQKAANDLFANHSMVFSNVPGPQKQIMIAGEPVEGVQAMYSNIIPQTILVSYNGNIHMNMVVDPDSIEDPESLAGHYLEELKALGDAFD